MAIETLQDAVSAAKLLYKGSDKNLPVKLDWWCEQLGPERSLLAITADHIDEGIQVLIETPKLQYKRNQGILEGKKQRSTGTINKYVGALGTMYKLLRTHRRLPRSFVSPVVKGLLLPQSEGRTLQVSLADVHKLVAAARLGPNLKLPALIAVACTTGLRKGSLQAITWKDVDLRGRTIDVARTKNGTPTRSVMPVWAAAELTRIKPRDVDEDMPVFGTKEFKRAWASAVDRAGLPAEWTFHHCRHIAASILAQSGASLPVIMQALNHKTPSMAMRYSHVNTKALEQAIGTAWQ